MAIMKDPPKTPAITPEIMGQDVRKVQLRERSGQFGRAGQDRVAVYQGTRPVGPDGSALPDKPPKAKPLPAIRRMGLNRKEALYVQALVGSSTQIAAFEKAFPNSKMKYDSRRKASSRLHLSILSKVGKEGMMEAMGLGEQATMEKIRQLKDAKMTKVFIVPETGAVVEAGPYEDNTTQMNAAKLMAAMNRMVDPENKGGGQVVVNIVQYNPPGTPPWPGGGRV
jgi:hypothetical protein